MIHNISKPSISENFTIDDIHSLREWNYECLKDATMEERFAVIHRRAQLSLRRIEDIRKKTTQLGGIDA
ncbi:MAG: hypothetical protein LBB79_06655 [Prevotellaceae bacterium]|jgi:hypothetical protein|nr:hypothetical protein [Prevotellaceae bacterium]